MKTHHASIDMTSEVEADDAQYPQVKLNIYPEKKDDTLYLEGGIPLGDLLCDPRDCARIFKICPNDSTSLYDENDKRTQYVGVVLDKSKQPWMDGYEKLFWFLLILAGLALVAAFVWWFKY